MSQDVKAKHISNLPRFAKVNQAIDIFKMLGDEFAIVENPNYIHPPFEFCPLTPKIHRVRDNIAGIVQDMDGTTTTTEALCLHSLEYMVRKITGREDKTCWPGLDKVRDYPHIIGNSTTKHVEYLLERYNSNIRLKNFRRSYLKAVLWTLAIGRDEGRKKEVENSIFNLDCGDLLEDEIFQGLIHSKDFNIKGYSSSIERLLKRHGNKLQLESFTNRVRVAVDIYYQRYHEILAAIDQGKGEELSRELLSESGTIAIRAAGIGLCVAIPFAGTQRHDLSAASFILQGGLPEAILIHNLFLSPSPKKL